MPIMSGFNLDAFRANLNVGARTYLFYMLPNILGGDNRKAGFLVRSTSLPASTITETTIPWQGYTYRMGTKQEFADWTVTFTLDSPDTVRNAYLNWMNKIHNPSTNVHGIPAQYMLDQHVELLTPDGNGTVALYKLIGAWPSSVGEVTLDYATSDIASFTVTYKYQYHEIDGVV